MQTIDLKTAVSHALDQAWPEFAQAHPVLASILDRNLLIEEAQKQIARDPAYQAALADANGCQSPALAIGQVVQPLVTALLARFM